MIPSVDDREERPAPHRAGLHNIVASTRGLLERHRILRFLIVGGVNTAFGYGLFLVALAIMPTTFSALVVSTILGILFNFRTTGRFVFRAHGAGNLVRFFGVYGVVFVYNAAGLATLEQAHVAPWLAGLLLLPGAVTISYVLSRDFVFRSAT